MEGGIAGSIGRETVESFVSQEAIVAKWLRENPGKRAKVVQERDVLGRLVFRVVEDRG